MEKKYSKVLGMQVISQSDHAVLGRVRHVLLDNDKGVVLAFLLSFMGDRIVLPVDVLECNSVLVVHGANDVLSIEEVQRVYEIKSRGEYILTKKVVTEMGTYLGRVYDFAFNTKDFRLSKIFANKVFLGLLFPHKSMIDAKHIVEIGRDRVVVRDAVVKEIEMGMNKNLSTDFN